MLFWLFGLFFHWCGKDVLVFSLKRFCFLKHGKILLFSVCKITEPNHMKGVIVNRKGHFENYETLNFQDVCSYFLTHRICSVCTREMYLCHQNIQAIILKKVKMLTALKNKQTTA